MNKRQKNISCSLLAAMTAAILLFMIAAGALAEKEQVKYIAKTSVEFHLRSMPNGRKLVQVPKGVKIQVIEWAEDWCLARYNNVSGYALNRYCLFYEVSGTVAAVTGSSALLPSMKATGTHRALGTFLTSGESASAVMGLAMGLTRAHAADSFALCYKPVTSLTPTAITQAEVNSIKALNGNVYVTRGYGRA